MAPSACSSRAAKCSAAARWRRLLAPSFPVGFSVPPAQVIGALRAAGFTYVVEVAYGADLVNEACHEYLDKNPTGLHIASACPAVVEYVRKYHPALTDRIMPIVSPMVATALAVKERYGNGVRCVFIGPCVAKKAEIVDPEVDGAIDEVLTLTELERVFTARGVDLAKAEPGDFDPPHAGTARIYPIPGGLFDSAGIGDGLRDPRLVVVSGKDETTETLAGHPGGSARGRGQRSAAHRGAHVPGLLCRAWGARARSRS